MNHPNPYRIAAWGGLLCLMVLGVFEATRAQQPTTGSITVDQQQVLFSNVSSGSSANQTIHVTSSAAGLLMVDTANTASWLTVTPSGTFTASAGSAVPLLVTANTAGPPGLGPGTYETSFTVNAQGNTTNPTTVMVTMTVGGTSLLTASPNVLNFTATPGALEASPGALPLTITSNGGNVLNFNVTATTQGGGNWLIPFTTSGSAAPGTPQVVTVGVNPAGLRAGTYFGEITASSVTTPDSVSVAAVLTVGSNTSSGVTPAALQPFVYQLGTSTTSSLLTQTITVSGTGTLPR